MASDDQTPVITVQGLRHLSAVIGWDPIGAAEQPPLTVQFDLRERPYCGVVVTKSFTFDRLDMFLILQNSNLICSQMLSCFRFSDDGTASFWANSICQLIVCTLADRGFAGSFTVVFTINALGYEEEEDEAVALEQGGTWYFADNMRGEEDGDVAGRREVVDRGDLPAATVLEKAVYGETGSAGSSEKSCAICLNDFCMGEEIARPPPCLHIFHFECLCTWTNKSNTCPLCRCEIPMETQR